MFVSGGALFQAGNSHLESENFSYTFPNLSSPHWMVFPGSAHGILPDSIGRHYNNQLTHMRKSYQGYRVGPPRELVLAAMVTNAEKKNLFDVDSARCAYIDHDWLSRRTRTLPCFRRGDIHRSPIICKLDAAAWRWGPFTDNTGIGLFAVFLDAPGILETYRVVQFRYMMFTFGLHCMSRPWIFKF